MDCNVIKDLLPLYIDKCCSEESAQEVKKHLNKCSNCKSAFESMASPTIGDSTLSCVPEKPSRVSDWKASILQSILLFISFSIITVGVALEAYTPLGASNGLWAFVLVIPATGFMLSLANWYFVRLYRNRKLFSWWSFLITLIIIVSAFIWGAIHYEGLSPLFLGTGAVISILLCVLAKILSSIFAKMLGKE